jgi:hypothetical protein
VIIRHFAAISLLLRFADPNLYRGNLAVMIISLPPSYLRFLTLHGPYEGVVRDDSTASDDAMPGYIQFWTPADLPLLNMEYAIAEQAPGFLAFASNGGGEVLAFDSYGKVWMLPLIGMDGAEAIKVADTFEELAARFEWNGDS